ncbi:MAG: hypothetical protein HQL99_01815 [Magnetococcales bacterium]|nr:hypothetical protein [Magnetococcales bacterium]
MNPLGVDVQGDEQWSGRVVASGCGHMTVETGQQGLEVGSQFQALEVVGQNGRGAPVGLFHPADGGGQGRRGVAGFAPGRGRGLAGEHGDSLTQRLGCAHPQPLRSGEAVGADGDFKQTRSPRGGRGQAGGVADPVVARCGHVGKIHLLHRRGDAGAGNDAGIDAVSGFVQHLEEHGRVGLQPVASGPEGQTAIGWGLGGNLGGEQGGQVGRGPLQPGAGQVAAFLRIRGEGAGQIVFGLEDEALVLQAGLGPMRVEMGLDIVTPLDRFRQLGFGLIGKVRTLPLPIAPQTGHVGKQREGNGEPFAGGEQVGGRFDQHRVFRLAEAAQIEFVIGGVEEMDHGISDVGADWHPVASVSGRGRITEGKEMKQDPASAIGLRGRQP